MRYNPLTGYIQSDSCLPDWMYIGLEEPLWWARTNGGTFLRIDPPTPGNAILYLNITGLVSPGTILHIGIGPKAFGHRENLMIPYPD